MSDFWGNRYHFTGEIKFTGTLDLYDGSKLGLIYAPQSATVTLDGVSGVLDVQPVKEGMNAAPGKAYFCRSYQLNVINGSQLYGPYLGKFYGFLDSGDETGSGKTAPGLHILSGSKVSLLTMIGQMASAMKERLSIRYPGMSHLKSVVQEVNFR